MILVLLEIDGKRSLRTHENVRGKLRLATTARSSDQEAIIGGFIALARRISRDNGAIAEKLENSEMTLTGFVDTVHGTALFWRKHTEVRKSSEEQQSEHCSISFCELDAHGKKKKRVRFRLKNACALARFRA